MSWQTKDNFTDCAIFVMRHMESYMGKPWKAWHTGLCNESVSNVQSDSHSHLSDNYA